MVRIWMKGTPVEGSAATLDLRDHALMRGDGCFEAMRSYGGRIFAAAEHLDRLERSADALRITLPGRTDLEAWVEAAAEGGGDAVIRVVVTRGNPTDAAVVPTVVIYAEPVPERPTTLRVLPIPAPWHPAGAEWQLAGVKSLSYAPNMSASRQAREHGFDDALLLSREGTVLEGPTYSIAWVIGGRLETPSLDLGILESVTRRHVIAGAEGLGLEVAVGSFKLARLEGADEVMALSTVKEVVAVTQVGTAEYEGGPITRAVSQAFQERRQAAGAATELR